MVFVPATIRSSRTAMRTWKQCSVQRQEGSEDRSVKPADDAAAESARLRERLSRLSEASRRVNESLDFDSVLQGVLLSARLLTEARYGVITLLDDQGAVQDFQSSGFTAAEARQMWAMPDALRLFEYLDRQETPLRVPDLPTYLRTMGLPKLSAPLPVDSDIPFMAVPVQHRNRPVGHVFVAGKAEGAPFTQEDEETLVIFASQAALVISSAHRHREEQRVRAELDALVDTSPVGTVVFDARAGALVSYNREALRIMDSLRTADEPLERLLEVLTVRREDGHEFHFGDLRVTEAVRTEEIRLQVPDGRQAVVLVNATPIHSDEGAIVSFVATLQDITPLATRIRLRAGFLTALSRQLREPLTSIKGAAAALLNAGAALDPAEAQQFHHIIDGQTDHLQTLIGNLLDVAHIEAGMLSVTLEPADVATLAARAQRAFAGGGGRAAVQLTLPMDLPRVLADPPRIVQVLTHLLFSTAARPPTDAAIQVDVAHEGMYVAIRVADNSVGMPLEPLSRLFHRHSYLDSDEEHDGASLDMAICRGIVEAHGGRMWAESDRAGPGMRFTFSLPVVEEDAARLATSTPQGLPIMAMTRNPHILTHLQDALAQTGYTPLTTGDPEAAVRLATVRKPLLALIDLDLLGTDGFEQVRDLPELARVPVIFVSGQGGDRAVAQALAAGGDDYLIAPFSPTELAARIQVVLRRRQATPAPDPFPAAQYVRGELTIDPARRQVFLAGQPLRLTGIEYRLLSHLAAHAGHLVTHDQLLWHVWGLPAAGGSGRLRTALKTLRRKLGDDASNPTYIFNEPRFGYRMAGSETQEPPVPEADLPSGS